MRVRERNARVPCVCMCASVLAASGGPACRARFGAPLLFLWPFCLSALLGPLQAGVAPFVVLWLLSTPPLFFFFLLSRFPRAALVSLFLWFPAPGALGLGALFFFPPPRLVFFFFFVLRRAPPLSLAFCGFWPWVPWVLALCAVCFVGLPFLGSLCALASLVVPAWPLAAPWWLSPPPPLCLAVFFAAVLCPGFLVSCCAPPLSLAFSGFGPRVPWALALCAVCFVGLPPLGSPCAPASFVVPAWPLAAPWCLLPPPPFVSRCFSPCRSSLLYFFFLSRCATPLSLAFSGFRLRVPWALALCAVCFVLLCSDFTGQNVTFLKKYP